jgi:hypothetical protein
MAAEMIASVIRYAILPWLFLLFAVILLKLLRGDINTTGLLRTRPGGPMDPERVTILAASLFAIGAYALEVLENGALLDPKTGDYIMPDAPESLLLLLGGANGLYLAGKLMRLRS